jgi:xanthine dehydrogenase accessory factor
MADKSGIIIFGLDELASAVGRMLLLSGHAVAMHAASPPDVLRRSASFSEAWYDGVATLEGVEARRVTNDAELLAALQGSMYIPVLTLPSFEAIGRWPWDVIIDARSVPPLAGTMGLDAELSIVLGPGAIAGADCDLVIETGGLDPGAVVRNGSAVCERTDNLEHAIAADSAGMFHADATIGDIVAAGDVLGYVGSMPVAAVATGRVRGLKRSGRSVRAGEIVAEIAEDAEAPVDLIDPTHKLIARSVVFTIEMEQQGQSMNVWSKRSGFDTGA